MRISTQQQYNINIQRMQNSQTTIGDLQRQISTGKKIAQPSDNPSVAAEVVRLKRDISALDRYEGNITIAENRLSLEEETIKPMFAQMDRIRDIAIAGRTGTHNSANLKTFAAEIREIVAGLAGAMNKQDAQGEFIFAGSKGGTQPYELNPDGRWEYKGDNGQREIQVGATHYIASNDSGQYLFESVEGELEFEAAGAAFIDPARDFFFEDDAARDEFDAYIKENVTGDLQFQLHVIEADTGTPLNAQYDFKIVDSSGKMHYPEPGASTPAPLTGLADREITFHGARIKPQALVAGDYSFPEQGARNGVQKITIDDQAALDKFFDDYGEVTVRFTSATTYELDSARTGKPIQLNENTTFTKTDPGALNFGGLTIDTDGANSGSYVLKRPSKDESLTTLNGISAVNVTDVDAFESFMDQTPGPATESMKLVLQAGGASATGLQYQIVDQTNTSISGGFIDVPVGDTLTDPTTGLTFTHDGNMDATDTYEITLMEPTGIPAAPYDVKAFAESTVKLQYEQKNILNVALELAERLEMGNSTPALREGLYKVVDDSLGYIVQAHDRLTEATTSVGARRSAMEDTLSANTDIKLFTRTTLSSIEDADLPAVASQLKLEEILLQASQQTFASTSRMTLFDYIN